MSQTNKVEQLEYRFHMTTNDGASFIFPETPIWTHHLDFTFSCKPEDPDKLGKIVKFMEQIEFVPFLNLADFDYTLDIVKKWWSDELLPKFKQWIERGEHETGYFTEVLLDPTNDELDIAVFSIYPAHVDVTLPKNKQD